MARTNERNEHERDESAPSAPRAERGTPSAPRDERGARNERTGGIDWLLRASIVMLADALLIAFSYSFALVLRFDLSVPSVPQELHDNFVLLIVPLIILPIALMWWRGLYRSIWSFVSISELIRSCEAWLCDAVIIALCVLTFAPHMPASFWIGGTITAFLLTTGIRVSWRALRVIRTIRSPRSDYRRVMVVGAGESGRALINEMGVTTSLKMRPVCAIDDNPTKSGRLIGGVPVVGSRLGIASAVEKYDVDLIIVAMPSAPGAVRKEIVELCQATGVEVRVVPGMYQLVDGKVSVSRLRHINLEDLLGRDPVVVDDLGIHDLVCNRCVLVTGGGGSIGSEICRQVAREHPKTLVIFDIYENNAYAIQQELRRTRPGLNLKVLIGSVRDEARVRSIFATYKPHVVFHAAAHKHVPLMEDSPHEAVKNNVLGTLNCARAAREFGTERFVLISTDKAVNPTNVMGASKRLCEMIVQSEDRKAAREHARTTFSAVRFGNVLGSNGSVVPLFEQQIANGGPVTVTDRRVIRYFMTIPEAVSLVLQSACYAEGGEIFVLDMGDPVRIDDMARNLIRLAGYEPDVDIRIEYTGLRPGEKLFEERLMEEEGLRRTSNKLISIAKPMDMDDAGLAENIDHLADMVADDAADVRELLQAVVPTYHPERGA